MNPEILTNLETCSRKTVWAQKWEPDKIHPTELLRRAMSAAVVEQERSDRGEVAGETAISLAADYGIDTLHHNVYDIALHHAVLADILVTHLGPSLPWSTPPILESWKSQCFLGKDNRLHRIILVDHWSEDRQKAEAHSWYTLGEMAMYELGMSLHIFVLGASKFGRRHSPWSRGYLHPQNKKLRFQKKKQKSDGFGESWTAVWREEHDEIPRERWIAAMAEDDVLKELAIENYIEPLKSRRVAEIRRDIEAAARAIEVLEGIPRKRYSVCDWPKPCPFRTCCWNVVDLEPSELSGYRNRLISVT